MKEQISQDLAVMGAKVAPPAVVAAATEVGAISPQSILVWLSVLYTASLLFTTVVKNWGEWLGWWKSRWADVRRLYGRVRGNG
ncbi:hypothetical protein MMG85_11840 [Pseudoxanthomonas sp. LH2527]|uniref:hypothetical protein n=1 Tax=Pseudoxanthomonas sp. LH2527 TaxID=2923249 RepID=UPI001F13F069|nr:hypothetical protein [Pseudoxanthomonas sp. LH2527]MCH6484249.1 hypothetical protein [Pseudoxanthomonas sp. LH2527]